MEKEYYTVNELTKVVNVTRQAIYNRIKTDLAKYVLNTEDKRILLDKEIVKEFTHNVNNNVNEIDNDVEIAILKEKLNSKEELVNFLTNEVKEIKEINNKLITLIEQNNELNKNNQVLLAQLQEQLPDSVGNEEVVVEEKPKKFFKWFK